jgi:hypothetical protein
VSVDADTRPSGLEVEDDETLDHLVCCDPDRALCGADVSGYEWAEDVEEPEDCVVCIDLRPRPCGKPFCRLRLWWRDRRGRR